jgi:hypothetical protein
MGERRMKLTIYVGILLLYRIWLPVIMSAPQQLTGYGAAGASPQVWMQKLDLAWYYSWAFCNGSLDCLPMVRVGCPWTPQYPVSTLMASCRPAPCRGLMVLNEPGLEDRCDYACQAQQLHDRTLEARAVSPSALIVFGNYQDVSTPRLDRLASAWAAAYPTKDIAAFMQSNNVRIGVHHYAWPGYDASVWRAGIRDYREAVRDLFGVGIALTEYGALWDDHAWRLLVADQTVWLKEQGIPAAVFLAGMDTRWAGCCTLFNADATLTERAEFYLEVTR